MCNFVHARGLSRNSSVTVETNFPSLALALFVRPPLVWLPARVFADKMRSEALARAPSTQYTRVFPRFSISFCLFLVVVRRGKYAFWVKQKTRERVVGVGVVSLFAQTLTAVGDRETVGHFQIVNVGRQSEFRGAKLNHPYPKRAVLLIRTPRKQTPCKLA